VRRRLGHRCAREALHWFVAAEWLVSSELGAHDDWLLLAEIV
jgi:hypothetical protein